MINLRYHIVSLAAVFLALALGVIAGTTVINPLVVSNLRKLNIARANTVSELRKVGDAQRRELQLWETFGTTMMPALTHDALKGMRLFMIEQDGTNEAVASGIEGALKTAGAADAGRVVLLKKFRLADDAARAQLAADVATTATDPGAIEQAAASALATRLTAPADPTAAGDLLGALQRDGFIALRGVAPGVFPPKSGTIVYLWSGAPDAFPDAGAFAVPLLSAMPQRTTLAVAEPLGSSTSLCAQVRANDSLARRVAGVDDADLIPGQLSLVSALRDVAAGMPAPQYGVGSGATAVVPPTGSS